MSGIKRAGREANHSSLSSGESKSEWSCISIPPIHRYGVVLSEKYGRKFNILFPCTVATIIYHSLNMPEFVLYVTLDKEEIHLLFRS